MAKRPRILTLSGKEHLVLELLAEHGERWPAARRQFQTQTQTRHGLRPLGRMEDKGYITSRLEDAPPDMGGCRAASTRRRRSASACSAAVDGGHAPDAGVRAMRRGRRLRCRAARLLTRGRWERVVDPAIADLQAEPPSVGRYLAVLKTIALCAPEVSMKSGFASFIADRRAGARRRHLRVAAAHLRVEPGWLRFPYARVSAAAERGDCHRHRPDGRHPGRLRRPSDFRRRGRPGSGAVAGRVGGVVRERRMADARGEPGVPRRVCRADAARRTAATTRHQRAHVA